MSRCSFVPIAILPLRGFENSLLTIACLWMLLYLLSLLLDSNAKF
jgi:hypothetical protein